MGPRALGNRSILADPRRADMRDQLNAKVKQREPFRPVRARRAGRAGGGVLRDRPARPVHDDGAAGAARQGRTDPGGRARRRHGRIQTVDRAANPRYYGLIEEFGRLTGVPVLLNTSFNRPEPIVASPRDAVACYLKSGMDVLVLGDYYVSDRALAGADHAAARAASAPSRETLPEVALTARAAPN